MIPTDVLKLQKKWSFIHTRWNKTCRADQLGIDESCKRTLCLIVAVMFSSLAAGCGDIPSKVDVENFSEPVAREEPNDVIPDSKKSTDDTPDPYAKLAASAGLIDAGRILPGKWVQVGVAELAIGEYTGGQPAKTSVRKTDPNEPVKVLEFTATQIICTQVSKESSSLIFKLDYVSNNNHVTVTKKPVVLPRQSSSADFEITTTDRRGALTFGKSKTVKEISLAVIQPTVPNETTPDKIKSASIPKWAFTLSGEYRRVGSGN